MSHDLEVTKVLAATPEQVYALVSDLPRMGEWSPENTGGSWVKGSTGPAVGAKFKGTNGRGKKTWTTDVTVTKADPGREFAFDVTAIGLGVAGWGFLLEPVEGGTKVTEYWDDHRSATAKKVTGWFLKLPDREGFNRTSMEQTLERMAAAL
ncbi:MAG: SRPBCC family protein [Ilumatobacteraceae bacterium]